MKINKYKDEKSDIINAINIDLSGEIVKEAKKEKNDFWDRFFDKNFMPLRLPIV